MFSRNVGILSSYIIGSTLPYKYVPCICLLVPVVFFILYAPLQNTCLFYLGQGKPQVSTRTMNEAFFADPTSSVNLQFQRAYKALKWYKGFKGKSEKEEMSINYEFERLKSIAMKQKLNNKFQMSDICELQ